MVVRTRVRVHVVYHALITDAVHNSGGNCVQIFSAPTCSPERGLQSWPSLCPPALTELRPHVRNMSSLCWVSNALVAALTVFAQCSAQTTPAVATERNQPRPSPQQSPSPSPAPQIPSLTGPPYLCNLDSTDFSTGLYQNCGFDLKQSQGAEVTFYCTCASDCYGDECCSDYGACGEPQILYAHLCCIAGCFRH